MLGKRNLSVQWFYFKVVSHESKTDGISQLLTGPVSQIHLPQCLVQMCVFF